MGVTTDRNAELLADLWRYVRDKGGAEERAAIIARWQDDPDPIAQRWIGIFKRPAREDGGIPVENHEICEWIDLHISTSRGTAGAPGDAEIEVNTVVVPGKVRLTIDDSGGGIYDDQYSKAYLTPVEARSLAAALIAAADEAERGPG
jgi:hypothetical protein